jgi:DNA-binding CsgD family transcriptional regulator
MTSRQTDQALFVTGKTAEVHLSRAYRKLGIRSCAQLAVLVATDRDPGICS